MIKAVEVQGVMQRNQDVASYNQNETNKPMVTQANVMGETKHKAETKVQDVNHKDNADHYKKNPDAKEKGNNEYFGDGGKKKKSSRNVEGTVKIKERQTFDVKI